MGDIKYEVCRIAILHNFAVELKPKAQVMRFAYFVGCSQEWPKWCEGIAAFSLVPGTASFELKFTLRYIIVQHITGNIIHRFSLFHIAGFFANNNSEFNLP